MVKSFKHTNQNPDKISSDKETLDNIEQLLQLHGYETCDLIHQYYVERNKEQSQMSDSPYGLLTVKCCFRGDNLEVGTHCGIVCERLRYIHIHFTAGNYERQKFGASRQ